MPLCEMDKHRQYNKTVKIAFAYTFNDLDWLGGRNYYSSLFSAIESVKDKSVKIALVMGNDTITSLPEQFPEVEILRDSMFDRRTLGSITRRVRRLMTGGRGDPHLASFLTANSVDLLSHFGGLGKDSSVKTLGWLPDFQFMKFPTNWTPRQLKATKNTYDLMCKNCNALIVSSFDALSDLSTFAPWCNLPRYVLNFISLPIDIQTLRSLQSIKLQYKIPLKYVLLPNQFWAHKNHRLVVDALAILKKRGIDVTVVCTGQTIDIRRPEHFTLLMNKVKEFGISENFIALGLIPYSDVQALMAHASCVLNPSCFEGWSTTVEEAKTLCKQVLLSDIAVHREQAPSNAKYFLTDDSNTLANYLAESATGQSSNYLETQSVRPYLEAQQVFGRRYLEIASLILEK